MTTCLTQASTQWANRPADQRFASLEDLHAKCQHDFDTAVEAPSVALNKLVVTDEDHCTDLSVIGPSGNAASFTHWSFGQLAREVGAPPAYLRTLPADLAADNFNYGLQQSTKTAKLLFGNDGDLTLRATTGEGYTRIWKRDVTSRLLRLTAEQPEWQPAPAAFDGSRGLYAGDCDMFAFLVDNDRRIFEQDAHGGLGRGFMVSNSEEGASSFWIMTFWYEYVCGNHRVWGARGVSELRIPHVGNADERAFTALEGELRRYADASASEDEAKIVSAKSYLLGTDKDTVLDRVFGLGINGLTRTLIGRAYDKAVEREDWYGNPQSAWGLTGGMTEIARDLPNANDRTAMDRLAGRVLQIAF